MPGPQDPCERQPCRVSSDRAFDTGLRPEDLDPERPEPFDTPWGSFAVYVVDGQPLAAPSFCPHMEGPLFQGTLAGRLVACPWHGWRFDLVSGACTWRPEGEESQVAPLKRLDLRLSAQGTLEMLPASGRSSE